MWLLFLPVVDETQVKIHCMSRELIGTVPVPSHLEVKLPTTPAHRGALDEEELFVIEGSKNPRDSTLTGGVRKMAQNAPKKPFIATNSLKAYLSLLRTGMSTKSGHELCLRHCRKQTSLHDHRDVQNRRNGTCDTSEHLHNRGIEKVQTNCNCGTCTVFWRLNHTATVVAQQRAVNDNVQLQRLQLWDLDRLLTACPRICWTCTRGTSNTLSMDCNWHGTKGNGLCAMRQCCRRPAHAQQRACQEPVQ